VCTSHGPSLVGTNTVGTGLHAGITLVAVDAVAAVVLALTGDARGRLERLSGTLSELCEQGHGWGRQKLLTSVRDGRADGGQARTGMIQKGCLQDIPDGIAFGRDDRDDLRDALVRGTVRDGHERQVHEESTMHTLPTSINDAAGKEQQSCLVVRDTREGLQTMRPLHLRSREGE